MKLENVLYDWKQNNFRICDFGSAVCLRSEATSSCAVAGSESYMAPEIVDATLVNHSLLPAADVWSLGIMLFVMVTGNLPWDSAQLKCPEFRAFVDGGEDMLFKHNARNLSEPLRRLLLGMLDVNADERLTLEEVLAHGWMEQNKLGPLATLHIQPQKQRQMVAV